MQRWRLRLNVLRDSFKTSLLLDGSPGRTAGTADRLATSNLRTENSQTNLHTLGRNMSERVGTSLASLVSATLRPRASFDRDTSTMFNLLLPNYGAFRRHLPLTSHFVVAP